MKKIICIIITIILCISVLPIEVFAEEKPLYRSTVDILSTESGYDTCEVYFYDDDCYMYIDDIVRYTRSSYVIDGDVLKISHGSRQININLSTNTLTEDGIRSEIKLLRNGKAIVIHAFPMLTYIGADCSINNNRLIVNMPECTLWEGLNLTGKENYVSVDIFGGKGEQTARLILNGLLSVLNSDIAHAIGFFNRREAVLLTTQVNISDYLESWERKNNAEKKQLALFSEAVELGEFVEDWEDEYDASVGVYDVVLGAVEGTLDNPTLFKEFTDYWETGTGVLSTSMMLLKKLSTNRKTAEDSVAIFGACGKHFSSKNPFHTIVMGLQEELNGDTRKTVEAVFYTGIESLLNQGFDSLLELTPSELELSLGAGVLITDLLDGNRDAFAYSTAETNAINLLYLKDTVASSLKTLSDKILKNNYSNRWDIEDFRLMMSLYYRTLIAINEQIEKMIIAQGRENDSDMSDVIAELHSNSIGFAQNLYILTSSTGKSFPKFEMISSSNVWDENSAIRENAEIVSDVIEGIGKVAFTEILSGVKADDIQYYNFSEKANFAVIKKDGKFGIIDYEGEILLPIEYDNISQGRGAYRNYLYVENGEMAYTLDENLQLADFYGGGDVSPVAYWYNDQVIVFAPGEGIMGGKELLYSVCFELGDWVEHSVLPIQKMTGIKECPWGPMPEVDSMNYALLNTDTGKLVSDFVYSGFDTANGFSEERLAVKKGNKWGFVDKDGKVITQFIYDHYEEDPLYEGIEYKYSIFTAANGYIAVLQNGKWGIIDIDGNIVVEPAYDDVSQVNQDGMLWLKEGGNWSLYKIDN